MLQNIIAFILLLIFIFVEHDAISLKTTKPPPPKISAKFLLAVNDTWDPKGCIEMIETEFVPEHQAPHVIVGKCDSGPLSFTFQNNTTPSIWTDYSQMTLHMLFRSSVIEDASPPTCDINWNGSYITPWPIQSEQIVLTSPLPGCFTMESREGYHMTSYWFYLLDWKFL